MKFAGITILGLLLVLFSNSVRAIESPWDQEALNKSLRQEAISGVIPRIEQLIKMGADINSKAPHGETALEYSVRFGRYGAALRLLQLGADPNSENDSGRTSLHWAAKEPNASRVVDALLRAGADVNRRDLYGTTALMNAAHADCIRTVAVILTRARDIVDIEAQNDHMQTAFSLARTGLVLKMLEMARMYRQGETGFELPANALH